VQPGIRAAESWRGLRFTEFELRRLDAGEKTWTPNAPRFSSKFAP